MNKEWTSGFGGEKHCWYNTIQQMYGDTVVSYSEWYNHAHDGKEKLKMVTDQSLHQ
jgi:hypothetical protein